MADRYARWLVARGNVFMPSSAAVAKLVAQLRTEHWIPAGGRAVKSVANTFGDDGRAKLAASTEPQPAEITTEWLEADDREELRLIWPVAQPPIRSPILPSPDGEAEFVLELHRAPEYVYPTAKNIKRVPVECRCGEDLSFEWDEDEVVPPFESSTGIFAECDECSRTFDPSQGSAVIENPFDGSKERVAGGAAYRFALRAVCGKGFVADPKAAFDPALVELVEKAFGRSFYEFGCLLDR
jgi:hypothetical protein